LNKLCLPVPAILGAAQRIKFHRLQDPEWVEAGMNKGITRIIERGVTYAPPALVLGSTFLNLTAFERQFLILIQLIWVNVFFMVKILFHGQ
jgi:hypothetical protein